MKNYSSSDVQVSTPDFPRLFASQGDLIDAPLDWQRRGLSQTASGYGAKLTTSRKISFDGKLYRVYCTCYGNAGSCWFVAKGRKIWVS